MRIFRISLIILLSSFFAGITLAQDVKNANGYVQVFEVSSGLEINNRQQFFFENDIMKITYLFWGDRGKMKVSIQNKTNKPIYVDWTKSFYKNNHHKLSYAPEQNMTAENEEMYNTYLAATPTLGSMDYEMNYHSATSTMYDTKVEGTTKIEATSTYTRSKYHLIPGEFYRFDTGADHRTEQRTEKEGEMTEVYEATFDTASTPLTFLSFIVFATDENFTDEQDLLHEFYVSKIQEMEAKHFRGEKVGKTMEGYAIYKFPFRKSTSFYVEIDKKNSVTERIEK